MSRTQHKLAEARFFLQKIDEHYYDDVVSALTDAKQPSAISFFLSAFVSAARSVTWIMRSEYSSISGWNEWFTNKCPDPSEMELLRTFNELRVRTQKIQPLVPAVNAHIGDEETARNPRVPHIKVSVRPVNERCEEETVFRGQITEVFWTLENGDDPELLQKCREYLNRLTVVVTECEHLFGQD